MPGAVNISGGIPGGSWSSGRVARPEIAGAPNFRRRPPERVRAGRPLFEIRRSAAMRLRISGNSAKSIRAEARRRKKEEGVHAKARRGKLARRHQNLESGSIDQRLEMEPFASSRENKFFFPIRISFAPRWSMEESQMASAPAGEEAQHDPEIEESADVRAGAAQERIVEGCWTPRAAARVHRPAGGSRVVGAGVEEMGKDLDRP